MTKTLTGLPELLSLMRDLPMQTQVAMSRGGMRAGAKPIVKKAKELVAVGEGDLRDSIGIGSPRSRDGVVSIRIRTKGDGAFKAPWFEFHGTAAHLVTARGQRIAGGKPLRSAVRKANKDSKTTGSLVIGGQFVGKVVRHPGMAAHPFMAPALDAAKDEALEAMAAYLRKRLGKAGILVGEDD